MSVSQQARRAWCDQAGDDIPVSESTLLHLECDAMCMGWSWVLYFCHASVSFAAEDCAGPSQILVDKNVYLFFFDSVAAVGVTSNDVLSSGKRFAAAYERLIHDPR